MTDKGFTQIELAVLGKLLDRSDSLSSALREQVQYCHVKKRESTDAGFFTELDVPRSVVRRACDAGEKLTLGDVEADIKGLKNGAGFVLFVSNGYLDMLEGFTYGEPWPEGQISNFKLYHREPGNSGGSENTNSTDIGS
ncbi:MAG: hypothetical protein N838_19810 [Thiohalocapsa sp. PB-PSB1]|jgi:hypothetical protein|nr:MAG: hypothetical protein N838_18390 [Thiohalocapsa sp. PB-PSB1]QQO55257.1 MAG: hypothetical protein N838_19810 [Thiohalocapsa sp. PB-PSB1]HCS92292.1 hypothetical protein [Chromatiaceae bacterium]